MKKNIIVVVNQKGGVGKTTTVLNLATALVLNRKKILVVDCDPQGNATTGAGLNKNEMEFTIYDALINDINPRDIIVKSPSCKFDILPSNRHLAGAEIELVDIDKREFCLNRILQPLQDDYDLIIIDCPPSLSLLTINALSAAHHVLVPIQCEYYALEGLTDLLNTIKLLQNKLNPQLEILGMVRTMFDKRNNLAVDVSSQLVEYFGDKIFYASIPRTVRLAEAPSFGASAVALDVDSFGAQAYIRLGREVLKRLR